MGGVVLIAVPEEAGRWLSGNDNEDTVMRGGLAVGGCERPDLETVGRVNWGRMRPRRFVGNTGTSSSLLSSESLSLALLSSLSLSLLLSSLPSLPLLSSSSLPVPLSSSSLSQSPSSSLAALSSCSASSESSLEGRGRVWGALRA